MTKARKLTWKAGCMKDHKTVSNSTSKEESTADRWNAPPLLTGPDEVAPIDNIKPGEPGYLKALAKKANFQLDE